MPLASFFRLELPAPKCNRSNLIMAIVLGSGLGAGQRGHAQDRRERHKTSRRENAAKACGGHRESLRYKRAVLAPFVLAATPWRQ